MRSNLYRYSVALLAATMFAACSRVPDDILSEKEMQKVMVDIQLAEAMIGADYKTYQEDSIKEALYQSVFRSHNITQAMYDSSVVWYGKNLNIYMEVYDRALKDIDQRIAALGDVPPETALSDNRDSIDIWPRRPFLAFYPGAVFNGQTFDLQPETDYPAGSTFVLGMEVWGLNKKMKHHPEIRISAVQGDTILTATAKVMRDGYITTTLKTLPTRRVKRVYGSIRMDNTDSCYYKVYADSISLMRYNYGTKELEMKTDSVPQ